MKRIARWTVFVIVIVGILALIDRSAYKVTEPVENTMFVQTETKNNSELTVEELREILLRFQQEVAPNIQGELEQTLAERMYVASIQFDKPIDVDQLTSRAINQAKFERAWVSYAKDTYGVVVTDEEVDEWIEKGPDATVLPSQKRLAEAKGISVYELNHNLYRDQYIKWVLWEELIPLITERYEETTDQVLDNNRLIELYEGEVRSTL